MSEYKLVELFTGTGAFSFAFENTQRVKTVFANDMCKNSEKIYNDNFKTKLVLKDINTLDINEIPQMDIITAGFSCQPFSIAGKQLGFEDERSNVFWSIINIMKKFNPSVVIFENVKNLQSHDDGNTFKIITTEIEKLKYYYKYTILNTCVHSDIPQNRERIYIVCFKNKEHCDKFTFPDKCDKPKIEINKIIEKQIPDKYYYKDTSAIWDKLNESVVQNIKNNVIYQYRRYYVRENKNNVCPTLTANMGTGGHNVPIIKDDKGIRKLTPRECFNIQGFPSTYKLTTNISDAGLYKLAGNAVSYSIVEKIAKQIIQVLDSSDKPVKRERAPRKKKEIVV